MRPIAVSHRPHSCRLLSLMLRFLLQASLGMHACISPRNAAGRSTGRGALVPPQNPEQKCRGYGGGRRDGPFLLALLNGLHGSCQHFEP